MGIFQYTIRIELSLNQRILVRIRALHTRARGAFFFRAQIVWVRMLLLVFGTTVFAVSTVLGWRDWHWEASVGGSTYGATG